MIIEARGVRRRYGRGAQEFEAVRGIDLDVAQGELVAVLGINGAGKTSFIELLEGMAPASAGSIRVFGADAITGRSANRRRTGIMLQHAGFAGQLTVDETLRMWAGTLTAPRPKSESIELAGLAGREGTLVKSLSGGERRRLDLALATMGRPELLFMDEPTTGLDPESRHRTWQIVRDMVADGTTVVLTTHYLEEAEELADRVLIMAAGQIVREGSVRSLTADLPHRISFSSSILADLPGLIDALPGTTSVEVTARTVEIDSVDLQQSLTALIQAVGNHRLPEFAIESPTLEQAFLSLAASTERNL